VLGGANVGTLLQGDRSTANDCNQRRFADARHSGAADRIDESIMIDAHRDVPARGRCWSEVA
jgi:hypothetical protein